MYNENDKIGSKAVGREAVDFCVSCWLFCTAGHEAIGFPSSEHPLSVSIGLSDGDGK